MARNRDVSDLLERFMDESGERQRWVTVNEVRTYFDLDEFSAPAIAGFLRRIYHGPFFSCPYRVERIEKVTVQNPHLRVVRRYLVTKRPPARKKNPTDVHNRLPGAPAHDILTDTDAINHFNRVLTKSHDGNDRERGHPGSPGKP